jgi:hypothetical protein
VAVVPDAALQAPTPAVPELSELVLDSVPAGATVTDSATKQSYRTPIHLKVKGSTTPRQYAFHLHGYQDATVELVPDQARVPHTEKLVRGTGAAIVSRPDTGSGSAVAHPDAGSAVTRPATGSASAPARPDAGAPAHPPEDDCDPDPAVPCLKRHIQGLGSGS